MPLRVHRIVVVGSCVVAWLLVAMASAASAQAQAEASSDELLRAWAPVLMKDQVQAVSRRGDYLTAFDFDGTWRLDNNPTNVGAYDLISVASTWWSRTERHALLGYTFYWPLQGRGEQNAVRSVVVLVERPSPTQPLGRLVGVAVQGDQDWILGGERDRQETEHPVRTAPTTVADVDFARTEWGLHPVVYSAESTHELSLEGDAPEGRRPSLFEDDLVVELNRFQGTIQGVGRGQSVYARGRQGAYLGYPFGMIYAPAGRPGLPAPANQRAPGRLAHHWELFSYALRPIDPLWERRAASSEEEPVVDRYGRLVGDGTRGPASLPPWLEIVSRRDGDGNWQRRLEPSEMFFGGTRAFSRVFDVPDEPILDSSLGSAAELERVRAQLYSGPSPDA